MERKLEILGVTLALVFLVFGLAAGAAKEQKVTVTLTDFKFTPAKITLRVGVPAEIALVNKGKVEHEFMVYAAPKGKIPDWDEYAMANTYFKNTGEVEGEFEESERWPGPASLRWK